jgi:hypothetical protein
MGEFRVLPQLDHRAVEREFRGLKLMADLFATGRIVDAVVVLMLLELIILTWVRKKTHGGVPMPALLTNLAAGAALLMSLRAALVDDRWQVVALWLIAALIAHVLDLKMRWVDK